MTSSKLFNDVSEFISPYVPLLLVFMSGIGFSLQTLVIKLLEMRGFHGSFQCVFARGLIQLIISGLFVYYDEDRRAGHGPKLFGNTLRVQIIIWLRSIIGYGGIAFSFLAVERLPLGDATVLVMLSPLFASLGGYFILGEPWRLPEFTATLISLLGATFVARPPFIFGSELGSDGDMSKTPADSLGVSYALIASLSAGGAYVLVRMLGTTAKMPWSNVCFAQAIGQIVLSIPSQYTFNQRITTKVTIVEACLICTGGFIGAWSQIAMTVGMQREKSATATAMRMSDVLFGFIWQVLFTSDSFSYLSVIGAGLVTASILIIVAYKPTAPTATIKTENNSNNNNNSGLDYRNNDIDSQVRSGGKAALEIESGHNHSPMASKGKSKFWIDYLKKIKVSISPNTSSVNSPVENTSTDMQFVDGEDSPRPSRMQRFNQYYDSLYDFITRKMGENKTTSGVNRKNYRYSKVNKFEDATTLLEDDSKPNQSSMHLLNDMEAAFSSNSTSSNHNNNNNNNNNIGGFGAIESSNSGVHLNNNSNSSGSSRAMINQWKDYVRSNLPNTNTSRVSKTIDAMNRQNENGDENSDNITNNNSKSRNMISEGHCADNDREMYIDNDMDNDITDENVKLIAN